MICVATVIKVVRRPTDATDAIRRSPPEKNPLVTINFDGWSDTYDYTASLTTLSLY